MKILITGAHFTPAVAVIEELNKYAEVKVVYVGRRTTLEGDQTVSLESRVLPSLGVKFVPIITGRLQRSFTIYTIPSLLKIPIGFVQAIYIILSEKPDVILSFGGYVAVPIVIMAWLFSIPIMIHEQTLVSGLANKISALFADKIAVSFDQSINNHKVILTGNPLRQQVLQPVKIIPYEYRTFFNNAKKNKLPSILVLGGNQGAHTINLSVEETLERLTKMACIIHVSGDNKFGDFGRLARLSSLGKLGDGRRYILKKWIGEEYGAILQKVDLVISRAGANTLYELAYLGKPALVIPFEPLYQDEQNKNAKYFANLGLVKILSQSELSSDTLLKNIKLMLNDLNHLNKSAKDATKIVTFDAAKRLALDLLLLGKIKS